LKAKKKKHATNGLDETITSFVAPFELYARLEGTFPCKQQSTTGTTGPARVVLFRFDSHLFSSSNAKRNRTMHSCKFLPYGLPLYIVALIVPWIFLYFWVHPTAEQWEQLNHFVLVEVSKNLYLVFLPTVPLFFYLQVIPFVATQSG